jgi:hypothetical protein
VVAWTWGREIGVGTSLGMGTEEGDQELIDFVLRFSSPQLLYFSRKIYSTGLLEY